MIDVINEWEKAAQKYYLDQEQSQYAESNRRVVMERFTQMSGKVVLDLGCGYGVYTEYFRSIGAKVYGIDGSEAMIALARQHYPNCEFAVEDITKPLSIADASFDLIFCNQVLMDIEHIEQVFSECRRILKPNGILYYAIVHPAFYDCQWIEDETGYKYAKAMDRYITSYELMNEYWGETTHFHRSLSYYLNAAAESGFTLLHIEEPKSYDGITKNSDLPLFFIAEYRK